MAELPKEQVELLDPFICCGKGPFGPFITKQCRKEKKGLDSSLTASLCVDHSEMLENFSRDYFINALPCR